MSRTGPLDRNISVVVASCTAYEDAARAVERIIADGAPATAVTIDGLRLHPAEVVVGERALSREASAGTLGGALAGGVVGFLVSILSWVEPLGRSLELALYGLLLGALVGAAAGVVLSFAPARASPSAARLQADIYAVAVEPEFADRAAGVLVRSRLTDLASKHPLTLS